MNLSIFLCVAPDGDDGIWHFAKPASDAHMIQSKKLIALRQDMDGDVMAKVYSIRDLVVYCHFSIPEVTKIAEYFRDYANYDLTDQLSTVSSTTIIL